MIRSLLTGILLLSTLPAPANKNRAVWFWAASGNIHGSISIVGTPVRETQTLQFFGHRGIKKCYGSYGIRPANDTLAIATWPTSPDFDNMMQTLESNYGTDEATDIQSYANWRQELITEAIGSIAVTIAATPGNKQADLGFNTVQDRSYSIYHTIDFCNWQEILRHRATTGGPMSHRIDTNDPAGFWKVLEFSPQE